MFLHTGYQICGAESTQPPYIFTPVMHTCFGMRKSSLPAKIFFEKPKQVESSAVWDMPYSHKSCCNALSC